MRFSYHWKEKIKGFPMILKSHDLDKWVAKYFVSKMKHIEILKNVKKILKNAQFSIFSVCQYHFRIILVSFNYLYFLYLLVFSFSFFFFLFLVLIISFLFRSLLFGSSPGLGFLA